MPAVKPFDGLLGLVLRSDQRSGDIARLHRLFPGGLLPVERGDQLVYFLALGTHLQAVTCQRCGHALAQDGVDIGAHVGAHGILCQHGAVVQGDLPAGYRQGVQGHPSYVIVVRTLSGTAIRGERIVFRPEKRGVHRRLRTPLSQRAGGEQGAKSKFEFHGRKKRLCF